MADVGILTLKLALDIGLVAWVVRRDQRRLSPEQLARTWNEASFWAAVVAFGPLCLPVHFAKARRSFGGFALGLLWAAVTMVVIGAITAAASAGAELLT